MTIHVHRVTYLFGENVYAYVVFVHFKKYFQGGGKLELGLCELIMNTQCNVSILGGGGVTTHYLCDYHD